MSPRECILLLKGHKEEQKQEYFNNFACLVNAIGSCFGGKKFKVNHPFELDEKPINKEKRREELLAEYEQLKHEEW